MSVILQIRVNGGAPQTGGVTAVSGNTIQFTAANKSTWSTDTEWRIYSIPDGFTLPAGWSSDANGYFYLGNLDPPSFTVGSWWGKLGISLRAKVAGQFVTDTATALSVASPNGLRGVFRGEGSQFGGARERWIAEFMRDLRLMDATLGVGAPAATKNSGDTLDGNRLNILNDNGDTTPSFIVPAPSGWKRLGLKRLNQAAPSAELTVAGGALIDGNSSYTIVGEDVAAELWSNGSTVYVGPTSSFAVVPETELPPTLAGRFYFFDPSVVSTITLSGSDIVSAGDALGGGLVLTAPTTGQRPVRMVDGTLNGRPYARFTRAANDCLRSTTGGPTGDAPHAIVALVRFNDVTTATGDLHPVATMATGNASGVVHGLQGGLLNFIFSGRNANNLPRSLGWGGGALDGRVTWQPVANTWYVLGVRYDPATQRKELWIDGEIYAAYTQAAAHTLTAEFGLGGLCSTSADVDVACAIFCNARPSDSEMQSLHRWIAARWDKWKPAAFIVCGDSLSQGQRPSPYGLTPWPQMLIDEAVFSGASVEHFNLSVSGYEPGDYETAIPLPSPSTGTVSRLTAGALWRSSGMRRAGIGKPGLAAIVWVASNGPATGETGASEWTKTQGLLSQLRSAGFKTIVATGIWRTGQNAEHTALDAAIRAGSLSWDHLVDLDQITEFMSATGSYTENEGAPASDGVHLKRGALNAGGFRVRSDGDGYGLVGWHFLQAINEALKL